MPTRDRKYEDNWPGQRVFPTLVVASAITGIALKDGMTISDMHEAVEWMAGHPVWTHELADRELSARVEARVREQYPHLPTREEAKADFKAAAAKAVHRYGHAIPVRQGNLERQANPIETLDAMLSAREGEK